MCRRVAPIMASLALGITLAGCIPGGARYYRPTMTGGQTVKHYCEQTPSVVHFRIGPLPGHALARKTPNGTVVFLELGTYLPARSTPPRIWKSFHFASDRFAARDPASHATFDDLPYQGLDEAITSPANKRSFLQITLPGSTPDQFELIGPPLVIDGKKWPFPPIRFEYELWIGILPFNC